MEMNPQVGALRPDRTCWPVGATVATQLWRCNQMTVQDLDIVLSAVLRVQLKVVKSELDLLTILRQVDEPDAVYIHAIISREVGRCKRLGARDHSTARRHSIRRVEPDSGYRSIRLNTFRLTI